MIVDPTDPVDPFPDTRARRTTGRLLAELLVTPDEELAKYRKRRLGRDSTLDPEFLRSVRGILEVIGAAFRAKDDEPWKRLREAWLDLSPTDNAAPSPMVDAAGGIAQQTSPSSVPNEPLPAPEPPPAHVSAPPIAPPAEVRSAFAAPTPAPAARPSPAMIPSLVGTPPGRADAPQAPMPARVPPPVVVPLEGPAAGLPWTPNPPTAAHHTAAPAALPFQGKREAPPLAASDASLGGDTLGQTTGPALSPIAALPFRSKAPGAPPMPALTVEQYALLCAERERFPERLADTNARYQLFDDVVRRTVDKNWQDRLAADPALYQTWAQLHAQYKAWLMGRRE